MNPPWLTDGEVDEMCEGLTQHAAKARYLRGLGLTVQMKPNGRPLVMRAHAEAVLSGAASSPAPQPEPAKRRPNRAAVVLAFGRRAA